ncbi:hypothetical protein EMPS_07776 [Entomortierella parvispora]|uniref:Uncharacterized protein n=1 Tax=Entomortierella parvispora TaxID=205924 RepID=A0A9P3HF60_9FUNG|nr:hypothetical protein EMPS_07776 [Entomortierella parvispora]
MDYDTATVAGKLVASKTGNDASINGAGGCAVAVVGMIAGAAGVATCVLVPGAAAACTASGLIGWFGGLFSVAMTMAAYECDEIGQPFSGNDYAIHCAVAEWVMQHPPPGGVPVDVESLYRNQCEDICRNPKLCD